ncbi:MAG: DNA-binding response regulator [Nitrospiraceae bacterium]|nr:MAG: DNA-binding response regulator [Nitrospiraceae bacterium]
MSIPKSSPYPIRLLLVDDHEVFLLGLQTLFKRVPSIRVVGEARTATAALSEAIRLTPDVVLMDLRLPDGTGVEVCREIRSACPNTNVLLLTSYQDDEALQAATFAGASGYLLKQIDHVSLTAAVETVAKGGSVVDPKMTAAMLDQMRVLSTSSQGSVPAALSLQQKRVLALLAEGNTNKEIAQALGLTDKTVANYVRHIFQKIRVSRRSQATAYYLRYSPDRKTLL